MLRTIGRRGRTAVALAAVLSISATVAPAGGAVPGPEPSPGAPGKTGYESDAKVRIVGTELDRRFGRAWLLATVSGEGHLRTVSSRVKSFAPRRDLDSGPLRIPLIPKIRVAKELRQEGHATVTVIIYFRPQGASRTEYLRRKVTLFRSAPGRPPRPHH